MTAYLNALGVICALGRGQAQVSRNLFAGDCSGMRAESGWVPGAQCRWPLYTVNWRACPGTGPAKQSQ